MADKFPLIANTSAQQIQEISSGDNLNLLGNSIVGVVSITASGNVSIGGTLTYEDVTNIDSVGIITARDGISVTGGLVNVNGNASQSTYTTHLLQNSAAAGTGSNPDVVKLAFGSGGVTKASIRAAVYGEGYMTFHTNNDTEKVRITSDGNVTVSGSISDDKGNLRNIPQNERNSTYTLVASDAGKHIRLNSGDLTIPSGVFSAGDAITIINNSATDRTITCSAPTTYLAGDTSNKSSLTLKGRGMATFLFISGTVCYGSGAGLE